ncbi:MAG TPA: hypothetical protein PLT47_05630, partial [Bacteroidales bacterium]|nr:hypothetical protein [Bacteroidales bacterium]
QPFFNSINGKKSELDDFFERDICRTTSAAPTYFETAYVKSIYGAPYVMIDGGFLPTTRHYALMLRLER